MKKIISLILALTMVFALAVTASADGTGVNIEITAPAGTGDMSALTYTAYKVFSASVSEDETKASYTIKENGPFWDVISGNKNFICKPVPGSTDEYTVTYTAGDSADPIITLLGSSTNKGTGKTATYSNGKFIIENVEEGYYYIESSFGTGIILDTVGKDTITVTPKNDLPTIEKKIVALNDTEVSPADTITATVGDKITFTVTITIPTTWDPSKTLYVHDLMDGGMTKTSDVPTGNYSTIWQYYASCAHTTHSGCLYPRGNETPVTPGTYTITYSATLNSNAVIGENGNKNTAILETSDNDYTVQDDVTVYTYQIDVNKYQNGDTTKPLAGAGFVLKNNTTGKYYSENQWGVVSWVDTISAECVKTSDADGKVVFSRLANGNYTLIEHVVPDGYNKAEDQLVTISDANATVNVNNQSGTVLPSTGGMGTTLFYVLGSLMAVTALVVLVTNKRMRT